jgi:TolB-like protein/Tfp pilus assembly protein PilF
MSSRNFFSELKRRNVIRMAGLYLVGAWLVVQVAGTVLPMFGAPEWLPRTIVILLAIGFVPAVIFSWVFELTPEGLKREEDVAPEQSITPQTGRRMDRMIIVVLVLALGYFAFDKFVLTPRRVAALVSSPVPNESRSVIDAKSIAVLPFENLSANQENAFFTDGVQGEILADLAKIADLKVISRTSVMQYKSGVARNLREIAQQLGVANVVEGSVQRSGNRVRVNAQLVDARNDAHLWAQTYDRNLDDVFAIQSEIAEKIAEQLQARLSPGEQAAIAQAPTSDLVANDLYVRARVLDDQANIDPRGKESFLQAISLLEEAVRRDPNFLLAYCLLCEANLDLYWQAYDHTPERIELANAALRQAERIQPDAGEVHMQKGVYAYHGFRDYDRARTEFELARRTLPNDARLYLYLGSVDRRQGRWEDAVRDFNRATELDPRNVLILEEAGGTFTALRRYAEATSSMERALALASKNVLLRATLCASLWQLPYLARADTGPWRSHLNAILDEGKESASHAAFAFVDCALAERNRKMAAQALTIIPAEGAQSPADNSIWPRDWYVGLVARSFGDTSGAQRAFTAARAITAKTVQDQPEYAPAWSALGAIDAGLGHKSDAIAEGKRACELLPVSKDPLDGPFYVTNLALIYAWVGEKDLALEQLAISAEIPAGVTYGELKLSPIWDPLRGDPRFEKIVASLAPK